MDKKPPFKKLWINQAIIKKLARLTGYKPKEVRGALQQLSEQATVRTRKKKGHVEYRAIDVWERGFPCDFTGDPEELTEASEVMYAISWQLKKTYDPQEMEEVRQLVMSVFRSTGRDHSAPRDQIWFTEYVFEAVVAELGYIVQYPRTNAVFLDSRLIYVLSAAGTNKPDTPASITNLRTHATLDGELLNVQDLVTLGQDEEALNWLRTTFSQNFGAQSILLMELVAEILVLLYPKDPTPPPKKAQAELKA